MEQITFNLKLKLTYVYFYFCHSIVLDIITKTVYFYYFTYVILRVSRIGSGG